MQLCRKKNIIIINVVEHKGTTEEKDSHIETPELVGDQGNPLWGKPLQIILLIFSSNDSEKECTVIHIFIYPTNQQNKYNIYEMNPTTYMLKTLILKGLMNSHCLQSIAEPCSH